MSKWIWRSPSVERQLAAAVKRGDESERARYQAMLDADAELDLTTNVEEGALEWLFVVCHYLNGEGWYGSEDEDNLLPLIAWYANRCNRTVSGLIGVPAHEADGQSGPELRALLDRLAEERS